AGAPVSAPPRPPAPGLPSATSSRATRTARRRRRTPPAVEPRFGGRAASWPAHYPRPGGPSPDLHALRRRPPELVAFLQAEGRVELIHVGDDAVRAKFARRVRVGQDDLTHEPLAPLRAPGLAVAEEKPLRSRVAVNHRRLGAVQRVDVGAVGDRGAREVADVLAERELAVYVEPGQRLERRVLLYEARGLRLELVVVLGRPPVAQVAVAVELSPAVVEAVADLVADHRTDCAVVRRVVRLH